MTIEQVHAAPRGGRSRCPLCFDDLVSDTEVRVCDACGTGYHPACFDELGGCSTTGCARARVPPAPARSPPEVEPDVGLTPLGPILGAALGGLGAEALGADRLVLALVLLVGAVAGVMAEVFVVPGSVRREVVRRAPRFVVGAVAGAALALIPYGVQTLMLLHPPRSPLVVGTAAVIIVVCGLRAAWRDRDPG